VSEAYLTSYRFGGDAPDGRSHFHETALREARIATEYRQREVDVTPAQPGFLARLRMALAGPSASAEACNCPA
jgi:hypothetical protein